LERIVTYKNLIPVPSNLNPGLSAARQSTMFSVLGQPRADYSQNCQPVTNPNLKRLVETADVGPFRATGLRPALQDLIEIFKDIKAKFPEVYASLGSDGMLCARYVRNSTVYISNHSWGTAIDLHLDGSRDVPGDKKVLQGLADIAGAFNAHGWYWGAAFGTEDGMHFEASDQRIRQYQRDGKLNASGVDVEDDNLGLGDRGPEVKELQQRLSALGYATATDGVFGPLTQFALRAFQAKEALRQTGLFDQDTKSAMSDAEGKHGASPNALSTLEVARPILRLGSKGPAVSEWQAVLSKHGYAAVSAEPGTFGIETDKATRAFQAAHELVVDGVVGPNTRAAAANAPAATVPATPQKALRRIGNKELTADIIRQAPVLLRAHFKEAIGTEIPFTSDGKSFVGVLEWHYNERMGKHKGFSVFVAA
jgi:peptidoglycan hydrolase-like protein with peptidoglycan-binding domain